MAIRASGTPLGETHFGSYPNLVKQREQKAEIEIISGELTEAQKNCKHLYKLVSVLDEDFMVIETCNNCGMKRKYFGGYVGRGSVIGNFKEQPFRVSIWGG